jgi:hypothetical protein
MRTLRRRPDDDCGSLDSGSLDSGSLDSGSLDSGSLAVTMLVMIAGVGLSAVIMASTMQTIQGTRIEQTRTSALQGARAGISSVLSNIRSAVDPANGLGSLPKLPCGTYTTGTTFLPQVTGKVGATSKVTYQVSISYLTEDPTPHDDAWISTNGRPCATSLSTLPSYAYVKSTGVDSLTGEKRTLFGVYAFRTVVSANKNGGQIKDWHTSLTSPDLCLDAGATPGVGTPLLMRLCATDAAGEVVAGQQFGYQPGLQITLVSADPALFPAGLCIDAGSPQKANNALRLQTCASTKAGAIQQEWSFNTASGFFGTTDGKIINSFCWSIVNPEAISPSPPSPVTLNTTSASGGNGHSPCNTNYPNNFQTWNPMEQVGPGGAGLPIPVAQMYGYNVHASQLVNFEEFGRCLDVTYSDVTKPFEVVFQCKQSPTFDATTNWNQAWVTPLDGTTGPIFTYSVPKSDFYCLTMPPVGSSPMLITVTQCSPTAPTADEMWWSRGASTTSPAQNYRIEGLGSWANLCLADLENQQAWQQADKAGLLTCNSDGIQKWNAVPSSTPAGLSAIGEK